MLGQLARARPEWRHETGDVYQTNVPFHSFDESPGWEPCDPETFAAATAAVARD